MKNVCGKFYALCINTHTGTRMMSKNVFNSFTECQKFVEKQNNKNMKSSIVWIATKDLQIYQKKQIDKFFKLATAE